MNILSTSDPWDIVAEGYASNAIDLFRFYADAALDRAGVRAGMHVADIACGPGALAVQAAERGATVDAIDFSQGMLAALRRNLSDRALTGVTSHHGDGQDLPFGDAVFEASFSLFGLMFFPDRAKGYAEMLRTLRPGGVGCVASWSRLSDAPLFLAMAMALREIDPALSAPAYDIASLENPDVLREEMATAGFSDVAIHRVGHQTDVTSAAALWSDLSAGSAPVALLKSRMGAEAWRERSAGAIRSIEANFGPFPTRLGTVAWIGIGRKP